MSQLLNLGGSPFILSRLFEDLDKPRGKQVQVKGTVKELKDADAVIHVASMKPVS